MRAVMTTPDQTISFEYHGSTMVEQVRRWTGGILDRRLWVFDTVVDAESFYYACVAEVLPCNG